MKLFAGIFQGDTTFIIKKLRIHFLTVVKFKIYRRSLINSTGGTQKTCIIRNSMSDY